MMLPRADKRGLAPQTGLRLSLVAHLVLAISLTGLATLPNTALAQAAEPVRVIFDTDMFADVDDVGALAVLHALQDRGEANIIAAIVNTPSKWGAPALDVINTYYNRPNIPIGTIKPNTNAISNPNYAQYLTQNYSNSLQDGNNAPSALAVYRQTLAAQPDNSVVIAAVGYLNEVQTLLNSPADGYSSLTGYQLVSSKVKALIVMGGDYPSGQEFNFIGAPAAASDVVANWPTRIVYSGFTLGRTIYTGATLNQTAADNPVRKAYEIYVGNGNNRESWDLTATYYAVRGNNGFYQEIGNGSNQVNVANGANNWVSSPVKNQVYLEKIVSDSTIASALESLITSPPGSTSSLEPVGHWRFDESSGTIAADSAVPPNNGTLSGGASWTSGKIGNALNFNGTNGSVGMGNSTALNLAGNSLTLAAWFKTTASGTRIISKGHYGWTSGYLLMVGGIVPNGTIAAGIGGGGSAGGSLLLHTTNTFNDGQWHYAAAVFDRSASTARIYVDGTPQNLGKFNGTCGTLSGSTANISGCNALSASNSGSFTIGSYNGTNEFFNGAIDEARIYNRALTVSEISALSLGNPLGWWKLDEGSGTTAGDTSGNGLSGSLVNNPGWTAGKIGGALNFNGINSYVNMGNSAALNLGNSSSLTLSAWIKTSSNTERIISKGHYGWTSGYLLMVGGIVPAGTIAAGIGGGSASSSLLLHTTNSFNDGQWHHVAAVFDRSAGTARIYVDGVAQNLGKFGGTCGTISGTTANISGCNALSLSASTSSGDAFTLGSYNGTNEFFNGAIDDARVYAYPLSSQQISSLAGQ